MAKVDMNRLQHFTASNSYPLTREMLVVQARQRGADDEILTFLAELPDDAYQSQDDAIEAFRALETTYQTGVWRAKRSKTHPNEEPEAPQAAGKDGIDKAIADSFPASDPPSWTTG